MTTSSSHQHYKAATPLVFLLFVLVNAIIFIAAPEEQKVCDQSVIQHSTSEARQEGKWTWWITRNYLMRVKSPDIALMGSSQMGAAVFSADAKTLNSTLDCVTHRKGSTLEKAIEKRSAENVDVFNFAMGGSMVSDSYMLSKGLFHNGSKPRLIVLGVAPRDFMDNTLTSPSATEPFAFFSPYVPLGELKDCAFSDFFGRLSWAIDHELPIKRLGGAFNDYVAACCPVKAGKDVLALAPPHKVQNQPLQGILTTDEVRPGEWLIPPQVAGWPFMDNTKEYLRRYHTAKPPIYQQEMAFFTAFLRDAAEERIPVLVVGMPSLTMNRTLLPEAFWAEFRGTMATLCRENKAKWVDISANPDFGRRDYLDTVHLNAAGGEKLFDKIAAAILDDPRLSAVITGTGAGRNAFAEKVGDSATNGTWQ